MLEKYSKFGFRFLWIETKDIGFAKGWKFNKEVKVEPIKDISFAKRKAFN
jgi:hypothetical protein